MAMLSLVNLLPLLLLLFTSARATDGFAACQLDCINGGYCNFVSDDENILNHIFASGGMLQQCVCLPGFSGVLCEIEVEQCQLPDLKCHNGMPCSKVSGEEKYFCDCSDADAVSKFAGAMCRNPATSYCGEGDLRNRGFCTNGGLCLSSLNIESYPDYSESNEYSTHDGCMCPPEFEGEHCEVLKGKTLSKEFNESNSIVSATLPALHVKESTLQSTSVSRPPVETSSITSSSAALKAPPTGSASGDVSTENTEKFKNRKGFFLSFVMSFYVGIILAAVLRWQKLKKVRVTNMDDEEFHDETPIRFRTLGEAESDDLNGLLTRIGFGGDGLVEDDLVSISECSLEEIELEPDDRFA